MREFQERRFWRKIFFSKASFIVLIAITALLAYSTVKIYLRSRDARLINSVSEKQLKELTERKKELEASIKTLESEAGADEEIRSKFQVQKPGEKTVVIVDESEKKNNVLSENSAPPGFFEKIWQFVKNTF